MNRIYDLRLISRFATAAAGLVAALVAFGAAPAFAVGHPEPGGSGSPPVILNPVATPRVPLRHVAGPVLGHVHIVVIGGMPGWQIALIAAAAALLAATLAITVDRLTAARRRYTATAA